MTTKPKGRPKKQVENREVTEKETVSKESTEITEPNPLTLEELTYKKKYEKINKDYEELKILVENYQAEVENKTIEIEYLRAKKDVCQIQKELEKANSTISACFTREFLYKEFIEQLLKELKG